MLNFSTRFGRHAKRRLRQERVIWLTTVDGEHTPQPRPVWFHWDGETLLIFSQEDKAKLRHIAGNPRVALSFNTDEEGGDVVVLIGEARILDEAPRDRLDAYLRKYRQGIRDLGMTSASFRESYRVPVRVTPRTLRGFA
jgi:PPOX class probable F420-dependent enzyme